MPGFESAFPATVGATRIGTTGSSTIENITLFHSSFSNVQDLSKS